MTASSFLGEILATIAERGRAVLSRPRAGGLALPVPDARADLVELSRGLVSRRGEASGEVLAREIFRRWDAAGPAQRREFLVRLASDFGPDTPHLEEAIAAWREAPGPATLNELHAAAEPKRQEVIRRLNLAPGGTARLVRMREELFRHQAAAPVLEVLDSDFRHLFGSWFNRGFLVLQRIGWATPANILEKIIRYEAVHATRDWDDLRRRIEPEDRRLFAFVHPQMVDDPLIFVEVALTGDIPEAIDPLLSEARTIMPAGDATTAVFYSISNCHAGLRGVSFGNFLIKQVAEDLKQELPNIDTFVTLSPLPGFADWLSRERAGASQIVSRAVLDALKGLDGSGAAAVAPPEPALRDAVLTAAAAYLLKAKTSGGKPIDPVARFHLGNGARLERINFLGDRSPKGLRESHGVMVNYLYDLDSVELNHEAFAEKGEIAASSAVRKLLKSEPAARATVAATPARRT
jgi:malonyl-CoA decarboxylase